MEQQIIFRSSNALPGKNSNQLEEKSEWNGKTVIHDGRERIFPYLEYVGVEQAEPNPASAVFISFKENRTYRLGMTMQELVQLWSKSADQVFINLTYEESYANRPLTGPQTSAPGRQSQPE